MKKRGKSFRQALFLPILWLAITSSYAAAGEPLPLPPTPTRYFNDYAGVVSPAAVARLNTELENLEKESSNQILVAIYPKMETGSSMNEYCHRIFATWHVGQKGLDNGAVLFVFIQNHQMRLETNTGLERALPDEKCAQIINDQDRPLVQDRRLRWRLHRWRRCHDRSHPSRVSRRRENRRSKTTLTASESVPGE